MPRLDENGKTVKPMKPASSLAKPSDYVAESDRKKGEAIDRKLAKRLVEYPTLNINGIEIPRKLLRITAAQMKKILKWESEEQFIERRLKEEPKSKRDQHAFKEDFLLIDELGQKIRCWNNEDYDTGTLANREFDYDHCRKLAFEILNKEWRFNGETMIVSKYGRCISLQHRGCALILAAQMWAAKDEEGERWREIWKEEPYIEALVVYGVEEDEETLMTLDNVKARSRADVVYTSKLFRHRPHQERSALSKIHAKAIEVLWNRVHASNQFAPFLSHAIAMDFQDRHPLLLECVGEMYRADEKHVLSNLGLSTGVCAAVMYLQAVSSSESSRYHRGRPPREELLVKDNLPTAKKFWGALSLQLPTVTPIAEALKAMQEGTMIEGRSGATRGEKLSVVIRGWQDFLEQGRCIGPYNLDRDEDYTPSSRGILVLKEHPVVTGAGGKGGIDMGDKRDKEDSRISPEKIARQAEEIRNENRTKHLTRVVGEALGAEELPVSRRDRLLEMSMTSVGSVCEEVAELKKIHPTKTILYQHLTCVAAYGEDAKTVSKVLKLKMVPGSEGLHKCTYPLVEHVENVQILEDSGLDVMVVDIEIAKKQRKEVVQAVQAKEDKRNEEKAAKRAARKSAKEVE